MSHDIQLKFGKLQPHENDMTLICRESPVLKWTEHFRSVTVMSDLFVLWSD